MANKISYIKNEEPAFIKAFKQKTGYKEDPSIDAKREELKYEDEDRSDNEDEKPAVVVLKDGDLTAEQVELEVGDQKPGTDDCECSVAGPTDGKITFKKPTKRQGDTTELQVSSIKKHKDDKKKKSSLKEEKKVKNCSLLSFDDDDDEED